MNKILKTLLFGFKIILPCVLIIFFTYKINGSWSQVVYLFKIRALYQIYPHSIDYLLRLEKGQDSIDEELLKRHVYFYERMVKYFDRESGALAMLGFCHYHLKQWDEALSYYQKAYEQNSDVFLYAYNVGVMKWNLDQREESKVYFKKARELSLDRYLKYLLGSKIVYRLIWQTFPNPTEEMAARFNKAHKNIEMILRQDIDLPQEGRIRFNVRLF